MINSLGHLLCLSKNRTYVIIDANEANGNCRAETASGKSTALARKENDANGRCDLPVHSR